MLLEAQFGTAMDRATELDDAREDGFGRFNDHKAPIPEGVAAFPVANENAEMIIPDVALAMLVNRTAQAYVSGTPAYMTYRETTRISAPSMGRAQDIDRSVAVRVADNFAVMRDLPDGGERTGEAFPIIA